MLERLQAAQARFALTRRLAMWSPSESALKAHLEAVSDLEATSSEYRIATQPFNPHTSRTDTN